MNKVYRKGIDLEVAFASGAKRVATTLPNSAVAPHLSHVELSSIEETVAPPENKAPQADHVDPAPPHVEPSSHPEVTIAPEHGEMHKPSSTKALLRPVARFVYRLLKPAFRPVAFRLRRYLVESMHQDVLKTHTLSVQELQRISADLLQEIQTTRESLRQDVLTTHALSLQAVQAARESLRQDILNTHALSQRVSAGMLQETQAARESLRQDVLDTHALSLQELQRVSADLLQEMQTARESLRQDVLDTYALSQQELKQVSAGVLNKLQIASESLRQDVQALAPNLCPRLDRIELYSATSARRVAINCNSSEILIKTEVGYVLCSASDHALVAYLVDNGELERGTRLLIQRFLNPGDVFIDIGANIGLHTLAAARAMQGDGKIIAIEPFEPTKHLLEKSVWMNGFSDITEIHQAAVSNKSGHQKLFLGATSGHHSLFPLDIPSGLSKKPVEVPLIRLDEVINQTNQKVNLIKIDVEGAELEVLNSATSIIKQNIDIALIVEFGPEHLKRAGHTTQQWLAAFANLGLCYQAINPDTGALEDWSLNQLENTDSINLFFAHINSKAWIKLNTANNFNNVVPNAFEQL